MPDRSVDLRRNEDGSVTVHDGERALATFSDEVRAKGFVEATTGIALGGVQEQLPVGDCVEPKGFRERIAERVKRQMEAK